MKFKLFSNDSKGKFTPKSKVTKIDKKKKFKKSEVPQISLPINSEPELVTDEKTLKKKKSLQKALAAEASVQVQKLANSKKDKKKINQLLKSNSDGVEETQSDQDNQSKSAKKKQKLKDKKSTPDDSEDISQEIPNDSAQKKKKDKGVKRNKIEPSQSDEPVTESQDESKPSKKEKNAAKKRKSDLNEEASVSKKQKKKGAGVDNKSEETVPEIYKGKKLGLPYQIAQEHDARVIFIGNLPLGFHKKKLLKVLKQYGTVETMWTRGYVPESDKISIKEALKKKLLVKDHPSTLIGFARYKTEEEAKSALQLNGFIFADHHLRVTMVNERSQDVNKGVFVGNLPLEITEDEVRKIFEGCGEIFNVRVLRDRKSGRGKGCGYVNFTSADAVELALTLDETPFNGREVRVKRLNTEGKQKKIQKKKEQKNLKQVELKKDGRKPKKGKPSGAKPRNKAAFKKKFSKTDLKKKALAEKLMSKSKKKVTAE